MHERSDLRGYVGLGDPRTFAEVQEAVKDLDQDAMAEVLGDLMPKPGRKKALLSDSRDVTVYAQALHNPQAHRALREFEDLDLARQIVREAGLPERLRSMRQGLEVVLGEVTQAKQLEQAVLDEATGLAQVAEAVQAVASPKVVAATEA